MEVRPLPVILVAALLAAGVYAAVRSNSGDTSSTSPPPPPPPPSPRTADPTALPPNHPPIGGGSATQDMGSPSDPPAITWKAPAPFTSAASTSSMRLATYRVAPVAGDTDPAELTVVRAGGTTDANIERWLRQFDDAGRETRTEKMIAGFKVTIVEVSGSYLGGAMTPTGAPEPKKGWSLLGAIVETPGAPYFFKMIGPTATVKKAHDGFMGLVDSITKA